MRNLFALPAIISSVVITILLLGFQRLGVLQPLELRLFDQMMQLRTNPEPDSRLLIVAVTEEDIKNLKFPLPGEVLDNLLTKLEQYEPRAIGLDIFRDLPVEPGHKWVCKINCVIASDSEAISKCCDCFVSLRSTRNDKCTINFA